MRTVSLGLCGLMLGACAFGADGDGVAQTDQDIVRGHKTNRYPQVVAVHVTGFFGFTQCTGTYVADRVVVTAAHCMRSDAIPGQTFIYHGRDYLGDRVSLPSIPAPGERSPWARVETSVTNPAYDPGVHYPDVAVLFLDRELPFSPMPLYRHHVMPTREHATIVGWGGKLALTPDISQVEGAGIKRIGKVHILGSPTETDFHADDPNPGILVPEIRADLLKTIGDERHANGCAGDSGGPLIVDKHGRDYMAGIGFWTGLSCEDYSMFTRTDAVIDFLDAEIARAGDAPIVPRLECVEDDGGQLRAHYGYTNDNGLTVEVPYGRRNSFPLDTEGNRPSDFAPGDNAFAFSVDFSAGQELTWRLSPRSGPTTVVTANESSPLCDPNDPMMLCSSSCGAALDAECADGTVQRTQCVNDCISNWFFFEYYFACGAQFNDYNRCVRNVPPDAENWDCSYPGFTPTPVPPNCDAELAAVFTCAGY
jgi:hypothetical protein